MPAARKGGLATAGVVANVTRAAEPVIGTPTTASRRLRLVFCCDESCDGGRGMRMLIRGSCGARPSTAPGGAVVHERRFSVIGTTCASTDIGKILTQLTSVALESHTTPPRGARHRGLGVARVPRLLGVFAAGRIIDETLARSQFIGGMTMGIGMALMEQTVIDERYGGLPQP
jgi:hypothetical protein